MVSNPFSYSRKNKMADTQGRLQFKLEICLLFHFARFYSSTFFFFFPSSFCVCAYLGLDVDKSPSQHILDIHVSRVPPTLGHFFLTSFFFRNLFDNTVISFLDRDRQKAFLDIYQDRKVWNVSSRGRSTL